jgi:DNA polymerase III alpha subunit
LELQTWNILTPAEKKLAMSLGEKFNYDLLNLLVYLRDNTNDKGKPYIKPTRFETIRNKYNTYKAIYSQNSKNEQFANWFYEKTVLGFSYSSTLKNVFEFHIRGLRTIAEINIEVPDIRICGIGVVKKCYTAKSKAGNPYAKINIEDETGEAQIKIFNQKLQLCKEVNDGLPEEEDIVIFKGTTKEGCIFADEIVVQNSKIYMRLRDVKEDFEESEKKGLDKND